jgi:hypothetical protein
VAAQDSLELKKILALRSDWRCGNYHNIQPVIADLNGKGLSLAKIAAELNRRKMEPLAARGGIIRRCGTCCNVSRLEPAKTP